MSELTAVAVQTREQTRAMRPSGIVVLAGVKAQGKSFRKRDRSDKYQLLLRRADDDTPTCIVADVLVFQTPTRRTYY